MAIMGQRCLGFHCERVHMNEISPECHILRKKKPYSKPSLTVFGSVRNLTGGSTFLRIDQFCGSSGNGFEDCFR